MRCRYLHRHCMELGNNNFRQKLVLHVLKPTNAIATHDASKLRPIF
jgi:hypothetical protein